MPSCSGIVPGASVSRWTLAGPAGWQLNDYFFPSSAREPDNVLRIA